MALRKWMILMLAVVFMGAAGCETVEVDQAALDRAAERGRALAELRADLEAQLDDAKAAKAEFEALIAKVRADQAAGNLDAGRAVELVLEYSGEAAKAGALIAEVSANVRDVARQVKENDREFAELAQGKNVTGARAAGLFKMIATATGVPEPIQTLVMTLFGVRVWRGSSSKKFKTKDGKLTDEGRHRA